MNGARYAIFFVPPSDSALYRFGATALGYDSYSGHEVASLSGDSVGAAEWRQLTAEPRRYGFHATLKPPFRLRDEYTEGDLVSDLARNAEGYRPPPAFAASIRRLDGFAAVVPSVPVPALNLLAEGCVRDFDRFRQPLTEAERARRLTHALTPRQLGHLDRWGYPYVFEDFRFHMTLTGRLPAEHAASALKLLHETLKRQPVPALVEIGAIALLRQDRADASFRVILSTALRAEAGTPAASHRPNSKIETSPDAFGAGAPNRGASDRITAGR